MTCINNDVCTHSFFLHPKELLDGDFWKELVQVMPESHEWVWSALTEVRGMYTVDFSFHSVITAGSHEEYQKNTKQYHELQKKVKHFQLTDTKRFHDIWHMNEDRARSLAREVLNADETIYRQQLHGVGVAPPTTSGKAAAIEREASQATRYTSQILSVVYTFLMQYTC